MAWVWITISLLDIDYTQSQLIFPVKVSESPGVLQHGYAVTGQSQAVTPVAALSIDGFHGTFYHGNWRALHHHAAC